LLLGGRLPRADGKRLPYAKTSFVLYFCLFGRAALPLEMEKKKKVETHSHRTRGNMQEPENWVSQGGNSL